MAHTPIFPSFTLPPMSVKYSIAGDIATVTLDRPDAFNAIDVTLARQVIEAMNRAGEEARAVVLTGSGKAFCAGADLSALQPDYEDGGSPDFAGLLDNVFHPLAQSISDANVPVVGAVNGVAAGAGMALAFACDIRVMAETAYFTSAFAAIGLSPDSGSTYWLPRLVGVARATEIAMTNRKIPADEAVSIGLVAEVCPDGEILSRAVSLASRLADLDPVALVATRNLIRDASGATFDQALQAEKVSQARLGARPEHREGVMAFLEKRKADFRGA